MGPDPRFFDHRRHGGWHVRRSRGRSNVWRRSVSCIRFVADPIDHGLAVDTLRPSHDHDPVIPLPAERAAPDAGCAGELCLLHTGQISALPPRLGRLSEHLVLRFGLLVIVSAVQLGQLLAPLRASATAPIIWSTSPPPACAPSPSARFLVISKPSRNAAPPTRSPTTPASIAATASTPRSWPVRAAGWWASPVLPGATHDPTAARKPQHHRRADPGEHPDLGRQGLPGRGRHRDHPLKGRRLSRNMRAVNTSHARIRAKGERAIATLKTWKILSKVRCDPGYTTTILKAITVLQRVEDHDK